MRKIMLLALMAMLALALYAPTALAKDDDGYDDDFDDGGGVAAPAQYDDVDGGGLMFSIPLNYGLSRADAADLSQVTFTILIQSLDSLDDGRLGAWLSTAARRHTWRLVERRRHEGTGKG